MTNYGLLPNGYLGKPAPVIRQELEESWKGAYGEDLAVGPAYEGSSVASLLSGILSDVISAEGHEPASDIVSNLTPESASDYMLDNVKSISGTYRVPARYSTVPLILGTDGPVPVPVPAGSVVRKPADGTLWITVSDVIIPIAGTVNVTARSEFKGPYAAIAGSITGIVTNLAGWDTVTNPEAAELGRFKEEDPDLRPRTTKRGSSKERIHDALVGESGVPGVIFASVKSNPVSNTMVIDGVPPGAVHCTVEGGDDEAIARAIYETKSSLVGTIGAITVTITDSEGNPEPISFSRITPVPVYLKLTISVPDEDAYPDNGDALIIAAFVAYGAKIGSGQTLFNWKLEKQIPDLAGVDEIISLFQGESPDPDSDDNLTPANTERYKIDAANIEIIHV